VLQGPHPARSRHKENGPGARNPRFEKPALRRWELERRIIMREHPFQEPDMPRREKSAAAEQQKVGAIEKGLEAGSRPETKAGAWPTVHKLDGGGKKFDARRKVPSGPVGGSGRKTNLARSS
jgi:hypothetical protein